MVDRSRYLARRTCSHVFESVKDNARYTRSLEEQKLFLYDENERTFSVYNGYKISFEDLAPEIRLNLQRRIEGGISNSVIEELRGLKVPRDYEEILTGFSLDEKKSSGRTERVVLTIKPKRMDNSECRTNNEDKLFFAIHNSVMKHLLRSIMRNH